MSVSKQHGSFSFQLSETPPPAEAVEGTPLGDLDLDLGDFETVSDREPEAEEVLIAEAVEPAPEAFGFTLTPVGSPEVQSSVPSGSVPFTVIQDLESSPVLASAAPRVESLAGLSPKIKKIQFPSPQKLAPVSKPQSAKPQEITAESNKPQTRFSKSIAPPTARMKLDSELESEIEEHSQEAGLRGTGAGESELAFPEDLPDFAPEGAIPRAELASGGASWSSDTPTAREIWKRARKSWGATSRQVMALSGSGLRAGCEMARQVQSKMHTRLREAEEESQASSEEESKEDFELVASEECVSLTEAQKRKSGYMGGSATGRVILGLARTTGRKLAAPLSAVAAAALVYWGGTELLGSTGALSLSKVAPGPEIPSLGSLEGPEGEVEKGEVDEAGARETDASESNSQRKKATRSQSKGPSPMLVESTEMPEGLSWPGKGLIEVVTSEDELIYVDGVFTGRGPLRRIPVSPGEHEVSIRTGGVKRTGTVQVSLNRNTRAVFQSE